MSDEDLITLLKKIREIAESTAQKITDVSVKQQVERIAGLADSAINKSQAQPDQAEGGRP